MPIFFCPHSISCHSISTSTVYVSQVIDGDTFIGSGNNRYRIFGIDTMELTSLNNNELLFANKAKLCLQKLIEHKEVKITKIGKDKYDRHLVKVYHKSLDIGDELVAKGLAKVKYISLNKSNPFYTEDYDYYDKLLKTQYQSFLDKKNLWQ